MSSYFALCGRDSITGRKYHECKVPIANEDSLPDHPLDPIRPNGDCVCGKYSYSIFHDSRKVLDSGVRIKQVRIVTVEKEKKLCGIGKIWTYCSPYRHRYLFPFPSLLRVEEFVNIENYKCCCGKTIVNVFDSPYIEEGSGVRIPQKVVVTYEEKKKSGESLPLKMLGLLNLGTPSYEKIG